MFKLLFKVLALAGLFGLLADAAEIVGDWEGALQVSDQTLRIALHVQSSGQGFTATMDSLDQGALGIPVTTVTSEGSALHFEIEQIGGKYEGTIDEKAGEIKGTWSQAGAEMPLVLRRPAPKQKPKLPPNVSLEGIWLGQLKVGPSGLRLQLRVSKDAAGGLSATLDSLDQDANGIPVTALSLADGAVHFEVPAVKGSYDGTLLEDLTTIEGAWKQGSGMPLILHKVDAAIAVKRPQTPTKPYPYQEIEVSYANEHATGVTLAGTLTIPNGKGPFPAALLITGSGAQDRDEALMGHRPFLILADYLTRHGIAVLRVDDRGFAKSTGDFPSATTLDFASDAEAGVAFLKKRTEVDPRRVGLIGHSEGANGGAIVASRSRDVAFLVMMAGMGMRGEDLLLLQGRRIAEASGAPPAAVESGVQIQRRSIELVREKDPATVDQKVRAMVPAAQVQQTVGQLRSPWMRFFVDYDPIPDIAKIKCPILVLDGEKDVQVPSKENLPLIAKALKQGGNADFTIKEMPALNHLFQTSKTGSLSEYSEIEETMSPTVLEVVTKWIRSHTGVLR